MISSKYHPFNQLTNKMIFMNCFINTFKISMTYLKKSSWHFLTLLNSYSSWKSLERYNNRDRYIILCQFSYFTLYFLVIYFENSYFDIYPTFQNYETRPIIKYYQPFRSNLINERYMSSVIVFFVICAIRYINH